MPPRLTALPASAAPTHNKNTTTFEVDCGDLGTFEVTTVDHASSAFGADGIFVAKHIEGTSTGSLAVVGGPTINFPPEQFVDHDSKGRGFTDRLTSCDFTTTLSFTFTLTAQDVAQFQLSDTYIGATATFTGTTSGTAEVLTPGT